MDYDMNHMIVLAEVGSEFEPPRLVNTDHFFMWKTRIESHFGRKLMETIKKGRHKPPMDQTKWSDEDKQKVALEAKAKHILSVSLPNEIYSFVMHYESAKEMWDNLILLFEGTAETREYCRSVLIQLNDFDMVLGYRCSMVDPPMLYNREIFSIWKKRMIAFLNFTDSNLLESVKNGPHIPPMEESKWSDEDKRKVHLDAEAKFILTVSLPPDSFCFVRHCKSAKERWDNLILLFEGTDKTRQNLMMHQYVAFTYKSGESVTQTYIRFNCLINELKEHNRIFDNGDMLIKFLTSVPPALNHVSKVIMRSMNFKTMSLQSLYGSLLAHEFRINHDALQMKANGKSYKVVEVYCSRTSSDDEDTYCFTTIS